MKHKYWIALVFFFFGLGGGGLRLVIVNDVSTNSTSFNTNMLFMAVHYWKKRPLQQILEVKQANIITAQ